MRAAKITNKATRGFLDIGTAKAAGIGTEFQGIDPEQPLFSIGTAAAMLEIHPRTLRIYEEEGLVKPFRKAGRRYYSLNDIQWIKCIRYMIHDQGISIAGIKRLLEYAPCWNIVECPADKRKSCTVCNGNSHH
ncbi:MAG: MerR family transcriptional regulator [Thermodesulfobacteria bacterium]|nr:MerR family transcriptional regulator [Thermodesulfobacteriota bacterium]